MSVISIPIHVAAKTSRQGERVDGNVAFCRRVGNPGFALGNGQMRDGIRTLEKRPLPVGPLQGDYLPIFSERNKSLGVIGLLSRPQFLAPVPFGFRWLGSCRRPP